MSVRTTIDIPDDLHAALRQRSAAERTSIRSLITGAIESTLPATAIAARDRTTGGKERQGRRRQSRQGESIRRLICLI
jgi:hypothetical protein